MRGDQKAHYGVSRSELVPWGMGCEHAPSSSLIHLSLVNLFLTAHKYSVTPVPMVGMFDAAIGAADASADYDKARTCAMQKLEHLKSLPYEAVDGGLQSGVCTPSGFGYTIAARPVSSDLGDGSGEEGLTMVTVTVDWDGGDSYVVSGVVSRW